MKQLTIHDVLAAHPALHQSFEQKSASFKKYELWNSFVYGMAMLQNIYTAKYRLAMFLLFMIPNILRYLMMRKLAAKDDVKNFSVTRTLNKYVSAITKYVVHQYY